MKEGVKVKLTLKDDEVIISKEKKNKYSLNKLLSKITKDNLHKEIEFGGPVGKELL